MKDLGLLVEYRMLAVGDYILPSGYAVERKEVHDFITSLFSGRLMDQASRLTEGYDNALLIVEGDIQSLIDELSKSEKLDLYYKFGYYSEKLGLKLEQDILNNKFNATAIPSSQPFSELISDFDLFIFEFRLRVQTHSRSRCQEIFSDSILINDKCRFVPAADIN